MLHPIVTASALVLLTATLSAQVTLMKVVGDASTGSYFGRTAARAGDIDRDGVQDFFIGLPNYRGSIGAARVYSGSNGRLLFQFDGDPKVPAQFGMAVGNAGDINGDGYPDPIISGGVHPKNGVFAGYVQLFSGKDGSLIRTHYGDGPGDIFGTSVCGVGDVNADGVPDYAVGAPENADPVNSYGAGYVKLFSGKDGSVLQVFKSNQITAEFGASIAAVGDVDKDGVPDFVIGALLEDNTGSARLYSGKTKNVIFKFPAQALGDHFGVAVGAAGDVDGDGYLDVLVGAANAFTFLKGTVWVFSGCTGKAIRQVVGSATSGMLGMWVQGVGDVNNDGFADFVGGDPMDGTLGMGRGSLRLYSGKDSSLLNVIYADTAGQGLGIQLDNMGDMNGDGIPELLCCLPGEKVKGVMVGAVSIRSLRRVAAVGSGCALGTNSGPLLDMTGPIIGQSASLFVRGRNLTPGVLLLSGVPNLPSPLGGGCYLHLDHSSVIMVGAFQTDANGRWLARNRVPRKTYLIGATFALQAALHSPASPLGVDLTNGVHVEVTR